MDSYLKAWKTKSNKINYSLIGENGETLYTCNQGFERVAGMIKNLRAIMHFLTQNKLGSGVYIEVRWVKSARSKTVIKTTTISI